MLSFPLDEAFKIIYAIVCQGSARSLMSGCTAGIDLLMKPLGIIMYLVRSRWRSLKWPEQDFYLWSNALLPSSPWKRGWDIQLVNTPAVEHLLM